MKHIRLEGSLITYLVMSEHDIYVSCVHVNSDTILYMLNNIDNKEEENNSELKDELSMKLT